MGVQSFKPGTTMVAPQPGPDGRGQVNAHPQPLCTWGRLRLAGWDRYGGCVCGPFLPDANMTGTKDWAPPATEALWPCLQTPWGPACRPAQHCPPAQAQILAKPVRLILPEAPGSAQFWKVGAVVEGWVERGLGTAFKESLETLGICGLLIIHVFM